LALSGFASYGVNRAVKQVTRRSRPGHVAAPRLGLPVRPPASSSFPSGHTLASFCTAVVLADEPPARRAALVFAAAVAVSRVQLGAHHMSDVVAGGAVGAALGTTVRPLVAALAPRPFDPGTRSEYQRRDRR
ncbi:MAG TPA: phosphatase PAP2 family protein, partial [Acidimicrobiales bacterium]|nr:phosphatase PAP2 family protein [Acidimicrobiales bacterium]